MKKLSEVKFTPELLAEIEKCATVEELLNLAANHNVELSQEQAEKYLTRASAALSDEEIDKVAGGMTHPDHPHDFNK